MSTKPNGEAAMTLEEQYPSFAIAFANAGTRMRSLPLRKIECTIHGGTQIEGGGYIEYKYPVYWPESFESIIERRAWARIEQVMKEALNPLREVPYWKTVLMRERCEQEAA